MHPVRSCLTFRRGRLHIKRSTCILMGMYVAIVVGLPLRIHPSLRPIDMRFDIGKRVVARVERRGSLCDSTEHVGILQGSPEFFPLPDGYLIRPSAEERTVRPAPLTNITDEADHTQKDPSITTATCGTHLITQRRSVSSSLTLPQHAFSSFRCR